MYFIRILVEILDATFVLCMLFRCVGFIMAKMVLQELMDPLIFVKFKSFLMKVNVMVNFSC